MELQELKQYIEVLEMDYPIVSLKCNNKFYVANMRTFSVPNITTIEELEKELLIVANGIVNTVGYRRFPKNPMLVMGFKNFNIAEIREN